MTDPATSSTPTPARDMENPWDRDDVTLEGFLRVLQKAIDKQPSIPTPDDTESPKP